MPPNNRDAGYLWDMLQAARRLQEFTVGLSYEAYQESVLLLSYGKPCQSGNYGKSYITIIKKLIFVKGY